jgi:GNAT superfamily N-acetyltransferase
VISVRPANAADVPAMSRVLTRSITELCAADHRDDPALVARWTANKSVAGVEKMLASEGVTLLVAERDGTIAAVGAIIEPDTIGLNYVDPDHRFAGVSKALLEAMEGELRARGIREARLHSTRTAHEFYLGAGWEDSGPPEDGFGMRDYPMRKTLA